MSIRYIFGNITEYHIFKRAEYILLSHFQGFESVGGFTSVFTGGYSNSATSWLQNRIKKETNLSVINHKIGL